MRFNYDVIVIGGGHAGCEAAVAAARLGASTLLITSDMNRIAQMSCNPAIGGVAKGQIVREVDALGGMMGVVADRTSIQFRMLNRSKGPAVWSPRAQIDRTAYIDEWRKVLDATQGLNIFQDTARELVFDFSGEKPRVKGVKTNLGVEFTCDALVLTAGTFLNGLMHFGPVKIEGGRISEGASKGIAEQLADMGFEVGRMKTGTPMRIDGRSIKMELCETQHGDDAVLPDGTVERDFHKFSYLPEVERTLFPRDCYIVHTNPDVHTALRESLADSPLYNGDIQSIGPRYCPSIETKIVTFADKDTHQLFLEPEGETTQEYYINGFSSSLPWEVQFEAISMVPALQDVEIYRPGYAIEYDFFMPTQLTHDLQTKLVDGLYFAGQVNGTTGYEEAAGQGLIAGVNAARRVQGKEPFVLGRDEAYIGVLIDDLVTKGVDEPYRMFTSRAEYRILLRQDDADMRLTPAGYALGLATGERFHAMEEKREFRDALMTFCEEYKVKATPQLNAWLEEKGTNGLTASVRLIELVKRPQLTLWNLSAQLPKLSEKIESIPSRRREEVVEATEILVKYGGYISREREQAEKALRLEHVRIPKGFDFSSMLSISTEGRQKLAKMQPATVGQASRIPGVSPADISVLLVALRR